MQSRARPVHAVAECHWSLPACRPVVISDSDNEMETYWSCERNRRRVPVTQADCDRCKHWTPERRPRLGRGRTR
jgi:hypothetical protein